jgi:nicotinate-nucleotide--dimethylbenzimidazole phosphoribosyltransferase
LSSYCLRSLQELYNSHLLDTCTGTDKMPPNDALQGKKKKQACTTVLDKGTVEARGMGTHTSQREVISQEILDFLNGEAKLGWTSETRAYFTVWIFITRLPAPMWVDLHPGYLMRGMTYFPLVGSLVGVFCGAFYDIARMCVPSTIASALSLAASLLITGCFHEDGLADSCDGIGGGWSKTQILRIMTDTRLGTYGCAALTLYLVTKLQLLAALDESSWRLYESTGAGPALLMSHAFARLTSPYLIRTNDYADEGGPKYAFYSFMLQAKYLVTWWRVGFAAFTCVALGTVVIGWPMTVALLIGTLLTAHFSGRYADYLLGGVMGDYMGATICITELVVLTMLVMKDDVVALFQDVYLEVSSSVDPVTLLLQHDQLSVIFRFVVIVGITVLWRRNVGPPDVYDRETAIANQDDECVHSSLDPKETGSDDIGPRAKAYAVCQDKGSSFTDRYGAVQIYLDALAKPMGSLGTLEDWAARLGALQKTTRPTIINACCLIFAADHGIAKSPEEGGEGCSAYPQVVTQGVLKGLAIGSAGASVLAAANDVNLRVVDVGVVGDTIEVGIVKEGSFKLQGGTRNSCKEAAMTAEEMERLLCAGKHAAQEYIEETQAQVLCLGEVGIGNTTTSSILLAAATGEDPTSLVDGGATMGRNVDPAVVSKKIAIVKKALESWKSEDKSAASLLARFGGAELVAIVGAIQKASELNIPVVVDGFIVTTAALMAALLSPSTTRVLLFATSSSEKGHALALARIQQIAKESNLPVPPLPALSMQLRMGEGTGALMAMPLLRSAAKVLNDMATLEDIL